MPANKQGMVGRCLAALAFTLAAGCTQASAAQTIESQTIESQTVESQTVESQTTESQPGLIPFEASYTAYKWGDDVGQAQIKLQELAPSQYSLTYSSEVSKFFLSDERFEHSIFQLQNGQLIPAEYHYSRTGTGPDDKLSIKFVDQPEPRIEIRGQAAMTWSGETDNQLYRIDVPRQLALGKTSMEYHFINYRGEPKTYQIDVVGRENIRVPFGRLDTLKVKIVRHASTRETYAWFAPSLDYNLVRLQQFKDGDEQGDIKLSAYRHL